MSLTTDQEEGLIALQEFFQSDKRIALLSGAAGVGKTYLLQTFLNTLPKSVKIFLSSPTNKAVGVQRSTATDLGAEAPDSGTIYSLLGLRLMPSGELKSISRGGGSRFCDYDLVVTDEAGRIDKALLEHIKDDVASGETKLILVGDYCQANPVKEEGVSQAFKAADMSIGLTKIVRQAEGSPIISIATAIRDSIETGERKHKFRTSTTSGGEGVFVLDRETWKSWVRKGFQSEKYKEDGNSFKVLAWRNKTVNAYNKMIRYAIYGAAASVPYVISERVLTAAPVVVEEEIIASTDSTGIVLSVQTAIHPAKEVSFYGEFKVWKLLISFDRGETAEVYALHETSRGRYDSVLDDIAVNAKKDSRLWGSYHAFRDCFQDIRPAHAITGHKSQGSSYSNVFVDIVDFNLNRNTEESLRLTYTACTRASNNLMLYTG